MKKENKKGEEWDCVLLEERLKIEQEKKRIQKAVQNTQMNHFIHKEKKL